MTKTVAMACASLTIMLGAQACSAEPKTCHAVDGDFWSEYQFLQGSSGPAGCNLGPFLLPVKGGGGRAVDFTRNYTNMQIETGVVMKGCTVGLTVKIRTPEGMNMAQIRGDVDVLSNDHLSGTVEGWVFDATGESTSCGGIFDAQLKRMAKAPPMITQPRAQIQAGSGAPPPGQATVTQAQQQMPAPQPAPGPQPAPMPMPTPAPSPAP